MLSKPSRRDLAFQFMLFVGQDFVDGEPGGVAGGDDAGDDGQDDDHAQPEQDAERGEGEPHGRAKQRFAEDGQEQAADREGDADGERPCDEADDHAFDDDGLHDDPVHRADGAHDADFTGALKDVDAHCAGQPHAADKGGQNGHDEQENNHNVDGDDGFLA